MLNKPGLTVAALCRALAAGIAAPDIINVYVFGLHCGLFVVLLHPLGSVINGGKSN